MKAIEHWCAAPNLFSFYTQVANQLRIHSHNCMLSAVAAASCSYLVRPAPPPPPVQQNTEPCLALDAFARRISVSHTSFVFFFSSTLGLLAPTMWGWWCSDSSEALGICWPQNNWGLRGCSKKGKKNWSGPHSDRVFPSVEPLFTTESPLNGLRRTIDRQRDCLSCLLSHPLWEEKKKNVNSHYHYRLLLSHRICLSSLLPVPMDRRFDLLMPRSVKRFFPSLRVEEEVLESNMQILMKSLRGFLVHLHD